MRFVKWIFLILPLILTIGGIVFIYSASFFLAEKVYGSPIFFLKKQMIAAVASFFIGALITILPQNFLFKMAPFFFSFSLILCLFPLLPVVGTTINGAHRWIRFFGISFQPAELLKSAFILYSAYYLTKHDFAINRRYPLFIVMVIFTTGVLLLQPDFGQAVVLAGTGLCMLFLTRCKKKNFIFILLGAFFSLALLVFFKPYRLRRLLIFLNPWADPQGAGFQIIQSLIAIAHGGWWGVGIGHSTQKFLYLPMQHTDFIFSIICEETGFLGGCCIIFLYIIFLFCGSFIASQSRSLFGYLTVNGATILISLQALINICVATGSIPTKGIGLPFISYGNSSLIGMWILVGISLNMSLEK